MLALKLHNFAKVVQSQEGRFPTMPGKINHRTGGSIDVLDNVLFEDMVGHAKQLALRIEMFLLQVVTIVTVQVADRATRLGKNLKFMRGLAHCSIPNLQAKPHKALDRNVRCPAGAMRRVTGKILHHNINTIERKNKFLSRRDCVIIASGSFSPDRLSPFPEKSFFSCCDTVSWWGRI